MKKNRNLLLIPHFNNPIGLSKSIMSIGKDEYLDILIVDDGSSKLKIDTNLIDSSKKFNGTIFYLFCKQNRGIEFVLNDGIDYALKNNYEFISRLDCGDLCDKNRFSIQEKFLDKNKNIALVGSYVKVVDEEDNFLFNIKLSCDPQEIKKRMKYKCMFIHPSIMFRSNIVNFIGNYPTKYKSAEDFAFFTKILSKFNGANIDQFLVTIEMNKSGISLTNRKIQSRSRVNILLDNFTFSFYSLYGLLKSYMLLYTPNKIVIKIKKIFFK